MIVRYSFDDVDCYEKVLINKLSNEKFAMNDGGLKRFCELSVNVLNKHAPRKKKIC